MRGFIIIYSGLEGRLLEEPEEFANFMDAYDALPARKEKYLNQPRVRVLVLGAESLASLKVTHGNFFYHESFEDLQERVRAVRAAHRAA